MRDGARRLPAARNALLGVPLPGVEVGIAASPILLGTMVATQSRPPLWMAAVAG